jgi:hypothetical protein
MKKNKKKVARRCPTAKSIDELLAKYDSIIKMVEQYEASLEPYKQEIVLATSSAPCRRDAERSRLLTGEIYEALVTRAISLKIDEKKVEKLHALLERRAPAIFRELFTKEISHVAPSKGAALFLAKLPAGAVDEGSEEDPRAKFMACQEMKEQNAARAVEEIAGREESSAAVEEGSGGVNEVYLFLLAITLGFGFALGGVLARLLERVVRFELRIRESRRRLMLKLDVDRELKKVAPASPRSRRRRRSRATASSTAAEVTHDAARAISALAPGGS